MNQLRRRHIFAISDVELGKKDYMDDFSDEISLYNYLNKLIHFTKELPITEKSILVLNGDTFDFLKMEYKGHYPRYITEEVSMWKMRQVYNFYPTFFELLKQFASLQNSEIHFIVGNHDFDLIWPSLQHSLQEKLNSERVYFGHTIDIGDLHIEHGNYYDIIYNNNREKEIIEYKGKKILNLPFGYYGVTQNLIQLKKEFHKEEKMYPKVLALKKFRNFHIKAKLTVFKYMFKELLLFPIIKFTDPTHRVPLKNIFNHFYTHGMHVIDEIKMLDNRLRLVIKDHPNQNYFVFGHYHSLQQRKIDGKTCLTLDTWRHEYDLYKGGKLKAKTELYCQQENDKTTIFQINSHEDKFPAQH